jgi:hypothetical protein
LKDFNKDSVQTIIRILSFSDINKMIKRLLELLVEKYNINKNDRNILFNLYRNNPNFSKDIFFQLVVQALLYVRILKEHYYSLFTDSPLPPVIKKTLKNKTNDKSVILRNFIKFINSVTRNIEIKFDSVNMDNTFMEIFSLKTYDDRFFSDVNLFEDIYGKLKENNNYLYTIYYLVEPCTLDINHDRIKELEDTSPSSIVDKFQYFYSQLEKIQNDLELKQLYNSKFSKLLININYSIVIIISAIISLFVNASITFTVSKTVSCDDNNYCYYASKITTIIHCALLVLFMCINMFFSIKKLTKFNKPYKEAGIFKKTYFIYLKFTDYKMIPLLWNFIFGLIAVTSDIIVFYALQLFTFVFQLSTMQVAFKSIFIRIRQFVAIGYLILAFVYICATVAFIFFYDENKLGDVTVIYNFYLNILG